MHGMHRNQHYRITSMHEIDDVFTRRLPFSGNDASLLLGASLESSFSRVRRVYAGFKWNLSTQHHVSFRALFCSIAAAERTTDSKIPA